MKINSLLESTVASDPSNATNSAPTMGRSDKFLEEKDETIEECTCSGSVASVDSPIGGTQRRAKGSMFAGISTSDKYPNSKAVKEGLPKQPKDEFKRQALLVKDRKTGKLYDPNVEFDKKMNSPEVKAQMKRMATKESQINEVDPRNFDSDEDYYAARNAPAKARSHSRQSPGVNQDDEAYFREIFRKKRLAAQQAERSADHDRLATGTNEGEEMSTFAALKDWQVWDVTVMNNYYRGKYADYGPRPYSVVASSPEEARQVVLNNADYVLQDLLSRKLQNGKKVLPRGSALPVEEKRVGDAKPGTITTMGLKKMLTPDGVQSFKFAGGKIVDGSYAAGGEQVNEKSKSQAQFRTMAAVAHNPEFAKKVGISQKVGKEFHSADRKQDYKDLPKEVDEASFDYTAKDLGNDYAGFPSNHGLKHKFLARIKPEKQQLYKDKMNNMHEFDQLFQLFTVAKQRGDIIEQGVAEGLPKAQDGRYNPDGSKKQAWHKDPRWQQHAKDLENDPKNIYGGVGKKKVKEQGVSEEKQRLDPKCWSGYKKQGTKMKGDTRVNNCVKVDEAEFTEDKLAQELYKDLQMFKKGIDKDIGAKAKDKDIIAKEESKGLWANIHAKQNRIKNGSGEKMRKPGSKGAPTSQNFKDASAKNESTGEYDDEAGSVESNLLTMSRAVKGLLDTIEDKDNLPEWVQEKIAKAEGMLVASWDYLLSQKEQGIDPQVSEALSLDEQFDMIEEMVEELAEAHGVDADVIWEDLESVEDTELFETAAWRRKEGKNKNGGLNAKGVASYRRENPGSKLQTAVTTKPSKLKKGSKAAKRRKSFCARMSGMKGPMKKDGKPTRKALALRKWNC